MAVASIEKTLYKVQTMGHDVTETF